MVPIWLRSYNKHCNAYVTSCWHNSSFCLVPELAKVFYLSFTLNERLCKYCANDSWQNLDQS